MAVSGSTNFNMTVGTLLNDALKKCGIGHNSETPTSAETNHAKRALDMILKLWSKRGLNLWQRRTTSVTLVASDADYTMGPSGADVTVGRPSEVVTVQRRDSNSIDTPLTKISREEYKRLSDKTTTGTPVNYYYDKQLTNGVLYVYPVPDSTVASEYTLRVDYRKPIDDADATTDDLEVPQEWYLALVWNVAKNIMVDYDLPENQQRRIEKYAKDYEQQAMDTDFEEGTSIFLRPSTRGRGR